MRQRWTPEHVARLRSLAEAGASMSVAAERLGATRNAVAGVSHRNGIVWASSKELHSHRTSQGLVRSWAADDGARRKANAERARIHFAGRWAELRGQS